MNPADGRIRKAVIPAAGLGSRMFPASKACRKALMPMIDPADGLLKPLLHVLVEEALAGGVEEVAVVVRPGDLAAFDAYFSGPVPADEVRRLPTAAQAQAGRLLELGRVIRFIEQREPRGFGDAVLAAREWVGEEPFLLVLGDHVFRSRTHKPCARQVTEAARDAGRSVVALWWGRPEDVPHCGVAGGEWEAAGRRLRVAHLAEKPTLAEASRRLRIDGSPDAYLCVFGLYALRPGVFRQLQALADDAPPETEVELTAALDRLREEEGLVGLVIDGERFDTGRPEGYARTLAALLEEGR